jgi:oxygen-independent coproporphyrinogen-3 oxidase
MLPCLPWLLMLHVLNMKQCGMGVPAAGLYLSIPFCKAKCSFCNFASGVFAADRIDGYTSRLIEEMQSAGSWADHLGTTLPDHVDSIYFGGGTPSLLEPRIIQRLFAGIREQFQLAEGTECTVECAPGQMTDASLEAFQREGVNRLSFGVQSFVDAECTAVGRLHTGEECLRELRRMRSAGISRLAIDLIVGLPHQTQASWRYSVDQALESGVEHISLYMLEVDEDSRLGREAMAGGSRYGAAVLPDEDRVADWYAQACEWLDAAGMAQYEISNFARTGGQSRHNRKYWERAPYVGFGLDAHSMLRQGPGGVRWANSDEMEGYTRGLVTLGGGGTFDRTVNIVDNIAGFEESLFLGLRLVEGVSITSLQHQFGQMMVIEMLAGIGDILDARLVTVAEERMRLTPAGRMVSNEVFERLLLARAA